MPDSPAEKKMDPDAPDTITPVTSMLCHGAPFSTSMSSVVFRPSQDYWPQDDPDHWSFWEDSQAGTVILDMLKI